MIIKAFLNKSKNLLKKNKSNNNNNIIINNYNNVNLNVNSLIMNKNYFSCVKNKLLDNSEKFIRKENMSPLSENNNPINNDSSSNNKTIGKTKNNIIKRNNFINEDINNISDKKIKKKYLTKSPSILSLICTPQNGKKLKLEKNNSFIHQKGEVNLFSYNNIQNNNINYNLNDTNLSNLLSSNSILNLNNVFKLNHLKSFKKGKENKKMKNSSIEHSLSFNKINISKYHKNKRTNKNLVANYKKHLKKPSANFKSKNASKSLTRKNSSIIPRRNNSCLKLKFQTKINDNTFSLSSTLLSPINKNDNSTRSKKINFNSTSNRKIKINKNNNYIQLRQINKNCIKNKLLFYFPNWNKIKNQKKFNILKIEEFKKKGKILMNNFNLKMKKDSQIWS
jgi:hypothetical protein